MNDKSEQHEGGCLCGAVRYALNGEPKYSANCHCRSCQRAIGAGFVTWVAVKKDDFEVTKGEIKYCETSPGMHRGFCGRCGSSLEGHGDGWDDFYLTAASLDDVVVYRVYSQDEPVAALFAVTARDGYSGPIRILVGVQYDGTVTGIRILKHRETPGLGDKIVSTRSDWVFQFDGLSLGNPELERWALKRDGGQFDQLTGASVTPRAVIKATRETLIYFAARRDEIFAAPATEEDE